MRKSVVRALVIAMVGLLLIPIGGATADQVILDDLIVDGSACVGFDCVNGESFGFDTLRIKENNLRIKADDTSTSASFPRNDWQLTFNETSNGGLSKFSVDDITNNRTPFTIEANAPSHSLYVDDGGRVGLGTSNPVVEAHVKDGDTPTLRLEQDGSSGFTPQTWDVAGNETNFFIRDTTNGSKLPFRIRPNAGANSIYIDTDSDVGFGTASPDASLHVVEQSGNEARVRLTSPSGTNVAGFDLLGNNGATHWEFESAGSFFINKVGSGVSEVTVLDGGNVRIAGNLTACFGGTTCTPESSFPDYVFQAGYDLWSLDELAAFIETERHLPGVPTAAEVVDAGGINMTQLQLTMLEKIEELTLYTIQQQERIVELEARLAALEDGS